MKLPLNGKWTVQHDDDQGLGILATKNIHFDQAGRATLANRTIALFDETDDANFSGAIAVYSNPDLVKVIGTANDPFTINITSVPYTITDDSASNHPTGSAESSAVFFASKWRVSENADMKSYNGSAWNDETLSPALTGGVRHPVCVHKGNNSLLVGNGAKVEQYDTSLANTTSLTIPNTGSVEVCGLAYNRALAAVLTWDSKTLEAWLYVWDGATAAANYAYLLGSNRAYFVVPWKDTFALLNGAGELLQWTAAGLDQLDALPIFYTSADFGSIDNRSDQAHDTAGIVDRKRILFGMSGYAAAKGSEPSVYNPLMPGGIWCFDEKVGLYHRHAPSAAKIQQGTFANPGPNDNAGMVLASGSVPESGTPFVITEVGGNAPGGLELNKVYYTMRVSATGPAKLQASLTRADALAGTFITITGNGGAVGSYNIIFFPESDFGQIGSNMYAGAIVKTGPQKFNLVSTSFSLHQKYAFSFKDVDHNLSVSPKDIFGIVMDRSENRGWILTQKMQAANITDKFQKLFVKARHLFTEHDKVIVKWRTVDDEDFPIYAARDGNYSGTWTDKNTFTTTADLSAAKTAFDAGHAYEVEILNGAGAGYLAHISAISLSNGTYTVDIDEDIRNIAANDTFNFLINNFEKLQTKDAETAITSASNPDFSEFPIGDSGKWVQLRFELRGYLVALEAYELLNTGEKPAL